MPPNTIESLPREEVQDLASSIAAIAESPVTATGLESSEVLESTPSIVYSNRLYISNVSYETTEEDLAEYFQSYKVTNVLIPNRTVRGFRSVQQRPLGIAYIVFENAEEAEKAAASLNGTALNNRKLSIKAHVPYSPVYKASLKKTRSYFRKKKCEPVCAAVPEVESSETGCKDGSCEEVKLNTSESEENSIQGSQADAPEYVEVASKSEREVSEDTIFVGKISSKTTDTDLRSFFADFNPSEIYIFKGRATGKRRDSLKLGYHSQVSALVRISIDNGQALAIDQLSKQKLNGKSVTLRPAFISKIEEVKKAVAAREAYLKKEASEKEEPEKESHVVPSAESSQVDGINHDNEGS